jgi:multidrug efflux pump subunit AcrA (membrane-fusion protein)
MMNQTSWWKKLLIGLSMIAVVSVLSIYFFYKVNPLLNQLKINVDLVEYGLLEEVITMEGLILRNETVYTIPETGSMRWLVSEGQKIARHQKIADILVSDTDQTLLLQQQLIQMRLDTISNGGDISVYSSQVLSEIEQQTAYLISDIRNNIQNEQYELAYQNQNLLKELTDQRQLMTAHQNLPDLSADQLESELERIEEQLKRVSHEIRTQEPGFLAIGKDGYENMLRDLSEGNEAETVQNIFNILNGNGEAEPDSNSYRIIHEQRWHVVLPIDREFLHRYETGQRVLLREPREQKEIRGTIDAILVHPEIEQALLKVELADHVYDWHQKRLMKFDLILERQEGLLIPASAVMEESNGKSVFKVDVNGYAVRMPVVELVRNDEIAVLREGPITVTPDDAEGMESQLQSIRHFDEVIVNPQDVVEGQKIR